MSDSLQQLLTVQADGPHGTLVPLDVTAGSLVFDEGWWPHVQMNATAVVPTSQEALDALDPRLTPQVRATIGYAQPNGEPTGVTSTQLNLRSRDVDRPSNELVFTASSDEAILQDFRYLQTTRTFGVDADALASIAALLRDAQPGAPINVAAPGGTFVTDPLQPMVIDPATDPYQAVTDIADRIGIWVYSDGQGTWQLSVRPALRSTPHLTLAVGEEGTITTLSTTLSRTSWANAVVVRHRWRDADSVEHEVVGTASTPDDAPRKVLTVDRTTAASIEDAQASAFSILARTKTRGRSTQVTAIADYSTRPGQTLALELPNGATELVLIARVSFDLATALMTITTRSPEDTPDI